MVEEFGEIMTRKGVIEHLIGNITLYFTKRQGKILAIKIIMNKLWRWSR